MRITTYVSLLGAAALAAVAGCTVKSVEPPALAGPSTMAHSITMVADRDTLTQNGLDFTDIRITSLGPNGQSENIPLRAQVYVDGVPQDFGTLSTKAPITPTTIRYTAPSPSLVAAAQTAQTVTIAVTPSNAGDFRGEIVRQVDIQLIPQGIILPSNPNLTAAFTFTPAAPQVMQTVSFDASTSTNNGSPCQVACTYSWNFGDNTSGSGQTTTHQFRTVNNFNVTLTVTDGRGATSVVTKQVLVAAGTPPTAVFTISPATPGVNQDVFFNATGSAPAAGRTITSYEWSFGDGTTASGVVQSHKFSAPGAYQIQLTTTDDAGSIGRSGATSLQVGPTVGALPVATMTCQAGSSGRSVPVNCNATASTPGSGSNIVSFTYNWGVGEPDEVSPNPVQSHLYRAPGTYTVTMTVRDSLDRTAVAQQVVTVAP